MNCCTDEVRRIGSFVVLPSSKVAEACRQRMMEVKEIRRAINFDFVERVRKQKNFWHRLIPWLFQEWTATQVIEWLKYVNANPGKHSTSEVLLACHYPTDWMAEEMRKYRSLIGMAEQSPRLFIHDEDWETIFVAWPVGGA